MNLITYIGFYIKRHGPIWSVNDQTQPTQRMKEIYFFGMLGVVWTNLTDTGQARN